MHAEATALYGGCLEDWGVDWDAAGYADEEAFEGSCATWAWEMQLLEDDATERGEASGGELEALCVERRDALSDEDATCQTYTDLEWGAPW